MERIAFVRASLADKWPGAVVCVTIAFAATSLSQHYGGPQLLYALLGVRPAAVTTLASEASCWLLVIAIAAAGVKTSLKICCDSDGSPS
jgi:hypothetical protein